MSQENRKLVSIQKIKDINPIKGADRIEVASVLGWKVVVRKGEFNVGDLGAYFEIDSLIPRAKWNDFLADSNKPDKPIRLRSIKLRGQISQGLFMPLNTFDVLGDDVKEGDDITDLINVTKYEPPIPSCLSGEVDCAFPSYIKKTDEHRIQAYPDLIQEFQGKKVYVSQKIDGTSTTISHLNGDVNVCGRNWCYKPSDTNTYWKVTNKYNIPEKLRDIYNKTNNNYGIQGECFGEGIQKNRLNIKGQDLAVFNIINLDNRTRLGFYEFKSFCDKLQLNTVPIIMVCEFKWKSVEELLELAKGNYASGQVQEGIVIRPIENFYSEILCSTEPSFKVINNDFLLGAGE